MLILTQALLRTSLVFYSLIDLINVNALVVIGATRSKLSPTNANSVVAPAPKICEGVIFPCANFFCAWADNSFAIASAADAYSSLSTSSRANWSQAAAIASSSVFIMLSSFFLNMRFLSVVLTIRGVNITEVMLTNDYLASALRG